VTFWRAPEAKRAKMSDISYTRPTATLALLVGSRTSSRPVRCNPLVSRSYAAARRKGLIPLTPNRGHPSCGMCSPHAGRLRPPRRPAVTPGALLVTVLGTDPKPARYTIQGNSVEAMLAPLALVQLLPEDSRPSRILALCTPEAKERSWPILERGLAGSGIDAAVETLDEPLPGSPGVARAAGLDLRAPRLRRRWRCLRPRPIDR
jgi:hypothetical protein